MKTAILEREVRSGEGNTGFPNLALWLKRQCQDARLSYRQAADRAGLSHSTIYDIINGARPSADTIKKLAAAFSNDGYHYKRTLEIALLYRCGYLLAEPEITLSEPVARLVDKVSHFTTDQLEVMEQLAGYIAKIGNAEPR